MSKRLGIIPHLYAQPLVHGLPGGRPSAGMSFEVIEDTPAHVARRLSEKEFHGALLPPIEYASQYSHLHVLPGVGVVSEGESQSIELVFKEGLPDVKFAPLT